MNMEDMANVVTDINVLITKYGLAAVKHAVNYVDTFPVVTITKQYIFKNFSGADWYLSQTECTKVNAAYSEGKIQAIKVFREITGCGLKDAKDAIEDYYGIKKTIW